MVLYQTMICRGDLKANPDALYCFGDNCQRIGLGGQAREMRGEPNAVGIATLHAPGHYFSFKDYDLASQVIYVDLARVRNHLKADGLVVFPLDGVGTGLARLKQSAPDIWTYLCGELSAIGIQNGSAS